VFIRFTETSKVRLFLLLVNKFYIMGQGDVTLTGAGLRAMRASSSAPVRVAIVDLLRSFVWLVGVADLVPLAWRVLPAICETAKDPLALSRISSVFLALSCSA